MLYVWKSAKCTQKKIQSGNEYESKERKLNIDKNAPTEPVCSGMCG